MVLKQFKRQLRRRQLNRNGLVVETAVSTATYGRHDSGSWTIHPDAISIKGVVYSFGIGRDVSWDLAMIRHHSVTVHGFDPTPGSIDWVTQQSLPEQFQFHPVGIAAHDGSSVFFPPRSNRTAHFSPIDRGFVFDPMHMVRAPVERLRTIMHRLGHDRLDVLKLDIEGGEYQVIPDVLDAKIPIRQILIEFHHNYNTLTIDHTIRAVAALREAGYRIFHISDRALEFGFISM